MWRIENFTIRISRKRQGNKKVQLYNQLSFFSRILNKKKYGLQWCSGETIRLSSLRFRVRSPVRYTRTQSSCEKTVAPWVSGLTQQAKVHFIGDPKYLRVLIRENAKGLSFTGQFFLLNFLRPWVEVRARSEPRPPSLGNKSAWWPQHHTCWFKVKTRYFHVHTCELKISAINALLGNNVE